MLRYCEFLLHFGTYVMLRYCEFLLYLNMKTVLHTMKCENLKSQLFEKNLLQPSFTMGGKKEKLALMQLPMILAPRKSPLDEKMLRNAGLEQLAFWTMVKFLRVTIGAGTLFLISALLKHLGLSYALTLLPSDVSAELCSALLEGAQSSFCIRTCVCLLWEMFVFLWESDRLRNVCGETALVSWPLWSFTLGRNAAALSIKFNSQWIDSKNCLYMAPSVMFRPWRLDVVVYSMVRLAFHLLSESCCSNSNERRM